MEQGEELQPIPTTMRGGVNDPETDRLSSIIQTFNDRYGTEFTDADKVRQMAENIAQEVAKNDDLKDAIEFTPSTARITSDKIAQKELLKYVTSNFDFYKLITDNEEAREDFNAMMFDVVKQIVRTA